MKLFSPRHKLEVKIRWIDLKDTSNSKEIKKAVQGKELIAQKHVSHNPLLTATQCRSLAQVFLDLNDISYLSILIGATPNFPSDLLGDLALSHENALLLSKIADHPHSSEETRVIAALKRLSV
jgi:hypothetical protein